MTESFKWFSLLFLILLFIGLNAQPIDSFNLYWQDSTLKVRFSRTRVLNKATVNKGTESEYCLYQTYYSREGIPLTIDEFAKRYGKRECFSINRKMKLFNKEWYLYFLNQEKYIKLIEEGDFYLKDSEFRKAKQTYKKALRIFQNE